LLEDVESVVGNEPENGFISVQEVIHRGYFVTGLQQRLTQQIADIARTSRYQRFHGSPKAKQAAGPAAL